MCARPNPRVAVGFISGPCLLYVRVVVGIYVGCSVCVRAWFRLAPLAPGAAHGIGSLSVSNPP